MYKGLEEYHKIYREIRDKNPSLSKCDIIRLYYNQKKIISTTIKPKQITKIELYQLHLEEQSKEQSNKKRMLDDRINDEILLIKKIDEMIINKFGATHYNTSKNYNYDKVIDYIKMLRRRNYSIYRLYHLGLTPRNISQMINKRYELIQSIIGNCFKEQCLKDKCVFSKYLI